VIANGLIISFISVLFRKCFICRAPAGIIAVMRKHDGFH